MDEHEDNKPIPTMLGTPGGPAPAGDPQGDESRSGESSAASALATVEAPSIAPTTAELTAELTAATVPASSGVDARKIEPPPAAGKFEEIKPKRADADAASRKIMPAGVRMARARAARRLSRSTWLAASVVLAAAFGATAGVLGASGLVRLAGEAAPVEAPPDLQATVTQLRSDIAALKAGVDAAGRNTSAQYNKLAERFDRVERAQSAAPKSDAALPKEAAKETTGSIALPSASPVPLPPAPVPPAAIVPGWAVRDVYRGVAMLQSRLGSMVEVEPGDVLPSLGRIEAIRRQDGRWVVITSKGMITSMR